MVEHSLAKAERVQVPPLYTLLLASSFSDNEWSRQRVECISPFRDRGEQQAAPCLYRVPNLSDSRRESKNLLLTGCWLFSPR